MKRKVGIWETIKSEGVSGQRLLILELKVVVRKKVGSGGGNGKNAGNIKEP